jgi:hypothetical protein
MVSCQSNHAMTVSQKGRTLLYVSSIVIETYDPYASFLWSRKPLISIFLRNCRLIGTLYWQLIAFNV